MYQFSSREGETTATSRQRPIVTMLSSLLRASFGADVTAQLRDLLAISDRRGYPTMDLLDAAEYEVLDELFTGTLSAAGLNSAMVSLSEQIDRATHTIPALAA